MRDLTKGNIHKSFLAYSVPVIISSILSMSFSIIDTSIAGNYLGSKGIASINATADIFNIISSIIWGYNLGISIYVARLFAAGKYKQLKKIVNTNAFVVALFSIIVAAAQIIFNAPILRILNIDPEIISDARLYFITTCIYMVLYNISHLFMCALNAMGETKFPLFVSIMQSIINLVGNYMTVAKLGMGVTGICIATLASGIFCIAMYLTRIVFCYKELGVAHYKFKMRRIYVTGLFSYSLPCTLQQILLYTANLFMSPIKNGLGYVAVAANSLAGSITAINNTAFTASTKAGGQYVAQCIGANKFDKVKKAVWVTLLHGFLLFFPVMMTIYCFPAATVGMFIDIEMERETYEYVLVFIKYFMPFILGNMVCSAFHSIFRGVKSTTHLIISSFSASLARLIISYIFVGKYGVIGLFIGTALAPLFEVLYIAVVYFTGWWIPKDIRPKVLGKPSLKEKDNDTIY